MAVGDAVGEEAAGVVGRAGGRKSRLFLAWVRRVIQAGQSHLFHTGPGPGPEPVGWRTGGLVGNCGSAPTVLAPSADSITNGQSWWGSAIRDQATRQSGKVGPRSDLPRFREHIALGTITELIWLEASKGHFSRLKTGRQRAPQPAHTPFLAHLNSAGENLGATVDGRD